MRRAHRPRLRGRRPRQRRDHPGRGDQVLPAPPTSGCSPTSAYATSGRTGTRRRSRRRPSAPTSTCDWHFIGALQSNKAAAVAGYADVVHSVDRAKLVGGLSRGAQERGRELDCLVQVSLDPPEASGRSGAAVEQVPALAERILEAEGLRLRGVMGVAPLGGDAREAFARLAEDGRRRTPDGAGGDLDLGRHERRPRGGDRRGCDTPADRLSGPRSEAGRQVVSEVPWKQRQTAPREQRKTTDERDAEDGRLPRPARGR